MIFIPTEREPRMCGIAGFSGSPNPETMKRMLQSLKHRGPDDQGVHSSPSMQIGMTRLSIIDLQQGHQPMVSPDGKTILVFNGEIYNYQELRKNLEQLGYRFKTASDTETILHGYNHYGLDFLHQLNGMFAIAIWDHTKEELLIARDRIGEKPLFFYHQNGKLVFASEIKAILQHPDTSKKLSRESISHFLSLRHIPAPHTIYDGIFALQPGHWLRYRRGDLQISRWYQIPFSEQPTSEAEILVQLQSLMKESVRIRLRSDVEVGAFLSGGLDSSYVVALMSELSSQRIKTFSLGYQNSPSHKKDLQFAQLIAERYGTDHYTLEMTPTLFQSEFKNVIAHLDQPFAGVTSSYWLTQLVSKHVKVALSGDGADDLFASYGHHRLVGPIDNYLNALSAGNETASVNFGYFKERKEFVQQMSGLAPWEWRLSYAAFMQNEKQELLSKEGFDLLGTYDTSLFLKNIYESSPASLDSLNRMLYLDVHTLLPNEILYYGDILSMAHSVEIRMPFLDPRLVELAASLPGNLKIRNQVLKFILRKAAQDYLPEEVINRPKEGFVLPMNTWLREELRDLQEILQPDRIASHHLFNPHFVRELLERFQKGDDSLTFKVWTLINFQLWYEQAGVKLT